MKQVTEIEDNSKFENKYNSYIVDLKRDNNVIKIKYLSGEEKNLPYTEETMRELNTEAAEQVYKLLSDIPFVTQIRNLGIVATVIALIPYLDANSDIVTIRKTAILVGVASFLAILSFILSDDIKDKRKKKIYMKIKSDLDLHYEELKNLKVYKTKGELTLDNIDKYTLRELRKLAAELKDILPDTQAKKRELMKKYGIKGIKQ